MRLSKIFWVLFDVLIVIFAIWFNVEKGPFIIDYYRSGGSMANLDLISCHYLYVWINIGFFMLAYTLLYKTHKAIFIIGALLSVAIANAAYFTIFSSSIELAIDVSIVYWEILLPAFLVLLTKRIKYLFISPILSLIILFLLPKDMGVYLFAYYLSYNIDVFLWTPIIWGIGALTILSFRKDRTIADSDQ